MLIYLPVPDLLISWLKSHKSAFARSLWFRVSIRLAIFFMTKCKNTLNLCLFVFCLFLWLLGCGFFFVQSHVLEHTVEEWWCHWRVHTNRQLHTWNRQEGREASRRIFSRLWVFFVVCVLFFSTACSSHLSGENGRSTPASPQICSDFQQFCYVKESLHFLSDKILAPVF